jgi:hypothetical protein
MLSEQIRALRDLFRSTPYSVSKSGEGLSTKTEGESPDVAKEIWDIGFQSNNVSSMEFNLTDQLHDRIFFLNIFVHVVWNLKVWR